MSSLSADLKVMLGVAKRRYNTPTEHIGQCVDMMAEPTRDGCIRELKKEVSDDTISMLLAETLAEINEPTPPSPAESPAAPSSSSAAPCPAQLATTGDSDSSAATSVSAAAVGMWRCHMSGNVGSTPCGFHLTVGDESDPVAAVKRLEFECVDLPPNRKQLQAIVDLAIQRFHAKCAQTQRKKKREPYEDEKKEHMQEQHCCLVHIERLIRHRSNENPRLVSDWRASTTVTRNRRACTHVRVLVFDEFDGELHVLCTVKIQGWKKRWKDPRAKRHDERLVVRHEAAPLGGGVEVAHANLALQACVELIQEYGCCEATSDGQVQSLSDCLLAQAVYLPESEVHRREDGLHSPTAYFFARHRHVRALIGPPLLAAFQRQPRLRGQPKLLAENIQCLTWTALSTVMSSAKRAHISNTQTNPDYVYPRDDLDVLDEQLSDHGGLVHFLHNANRA